MSDRKRWRTVSANRPVSLRTCEEHGKQLYASRRDAKAVAKQMSSGGHPDTYRCELHDGYHWGRLGPTVIRGVVTRAERYGQ